MIARTQSLGLFNGAGQRRGLGDLAGTWQNPGNDEERVKFRLEYYTLVWFEHNGTWLNQTITIEDYLVIIYQSWLQIVMLREKQDLKGSIFKEHGIFGTKWFVAFGGSDDSRAKTDPKYNADCRFNCKCYRDTAIDYNLFVRDIAVPYFTDKVPVQLKTQYVRYDNPDKKLMPIDVFIQLAFQIELAFYSVHYGCHHKMNLTDNMLHLLLSPVSAIAQTFVEIVNHYKDVDQAWKSKDIVDLDKKVLQPVRQNQEAAFRNQALMYGGFGLAGLAVMAVVFKSMNKDGALKMWQWGILGGAGIIGGKMAYEKFNQKSTFFTNA